MSENQKYAVVREIDLAKDAQKDTTALESENMHLRIALEFYADSMAYPLAVGSLQNFKACRDMGSTARKALGLE